MRKKISVLLALAFLLSACADFKEARRADISQPINSGGSIVSFNQAGTMLASGDWAGGLALWKTPDGAEIARWPAHDTTINGIAFLADDSRLLTASFDSTMALWNMRGKLIRRVETPSPIMHMAADDSAGFIVTGHKDGIVRIWDSREIEPVSSYDSHQQKILAVALNAKTGRIASSASNGTVFVRFTDGSLSELPSPSTDASTLSFAPDGNTLYGGGWFKMFSWDVQTRDLTVLPTEHHGLIRSLQASSDGAYIASISRQTDSAVLFLDPEKGEVTGRFGKHALCGAYVAVSDDGRFLASTSDDATIKLWALHNIQ